MYISLYVPSQSATKSLTPTLVNDCLLHVMKTFSRLFGGCTTTATKGGWLSSTGDIIIEDVQIVRAYTETATTDAISSVMAEAASLKANMAQEAVAIEIGDKMIFV